MTRDARGHVAVMPLRGGDEGHAPVSGLGGNRVATLATARAAENEERRHPRVLPRRPVKMRARAGLLALGSSYSPHLPGRNPLGAASGQSRGSSPITVTGSRRLHTAFPR